jgi:hypothetical protein
MARGTVELQGEFDLGYVLGQIENEDIVGYVGAADLLDEIGMNEAIEHFKESDILLEIGKQVVMDYFGLIEPE